MKFPDTNQGQPDSYDLHTFGGGHVISTYTPNTEERSAKAKKDLAEAEKLQAQANQINDNLQWNTLKVRVLYGVYTLGIFSLGWFACFLVNKYA